MSETTEFGYFAFAERYQAPVDTVLGETMPPHVTISHWTETRYDLGAIIVRAELALGSLCSIATVATERAVLEGERDVTLLDLTPDLFELHMASLETLGDKNILSAEKYRGLSYKPHSSDKPGHQLTVGETVKIDSVDLVERSSSGIRTVRHRVHLATAV